MNKFIKYLQSQSLEPVPDMDILETMAGNYKSYIIESPIYPMVKINNDRMRLYFPTPYKYNTKSEDLKLIKYTQKLIADHAPGKKEIILDLRGNLGGNFSVFYSALYALLPDYKNDTIITGVNSINEEIMQMKNINDKLYIEFDNPSGNGKSKFYFDLIPQKVNHNAKIKVEINEKSMSSSQLIAIMFLQLDEYGPSRVSGYAPELYTNGSASIPGFDGNSVVFPYYYFKDKKGKIYKDGVIF